MAIVLNRPARPLVLAARQVLGTTLRALGPSLGASERTAQRWVKGESAPTVEMMRKLARLVHPRDAKLAAEIAAAASETLVSLGIVPPPKSPPLLTRDVARDAILCAAADAMSTSPSAARAGLTAAFARARELGVSPDELEKLAG